MRTDVLDCSTWHVDDIIDASYDLECINMASKKAQYDIEYAKENLKRISVNFQKDEFETRIKPSIEKTGLPLSTFIKTAIYEKIDREGLSVK